MFDWLRRYGWAIAAHLALLLLWQVAVTVGGVPKFVLPSPADTLATIVQPHYNWGTHVSTTATEVFGGYLLAVVVGVSIALVMTWWRALNRAMMPLLVTLNMIPKIAMAPLFIVWLSYGVVPNIVITFAICFFPIVLTAMRGFKEVEPDLLDLVRALKGTRWQIFTKIQLPGALPYIFSGMKVASVFAVAGAIVGEFIGSDRGLGNLMLTAQATLDTAGMFMAVILVTLIGVALYGIVFALERWIVVRDARVES
jgi:NitT/TauT family transport system permease protein